MTTELKENESKEEKKVLKAPKKKSQRCINLEKDRRMVKGMFKCDEQQGGMLKFHFKKYKEIPLKTYSFFDGQIYEVPYMIATHINNNCWYPVHSHLKDENGKVTTRVGEKIKRYSFIPLDFIIEDTNADKKIITVERV